MNIEIKLDTKGQAYAGVDQTSLISDIEAEIGKLAVEVKGEPSRRDIPAPQGAQGELEAVQWIMEVAKDPKMAVIYARTLIFAINQILESYRAKNKSNSTPISPSSTQATPPEQGLQAKIKAFGQTISLPATTIAIQEFLKSIGDT